MQTNKVYVVGDDNSPKTNQWQFMTACRETAEAEKTARGLTQIKEVDIRPRRGRRGRK